VRRAVRRSVLAALVLAALPGRAHASEEPTPTPTATATATPTPTSTVTTTSVTGATLRWGMSQESGNRAHAPGTVNLFSAGRRPDPGRGGVQIAAEQWRQSDGAVSVQKWTGGAWQPATWAGLSTTSDGAPLGPPAAGTTSNHTFVFAGGTGEVDTARGTARISWSGSVTVLYYSGMSAFVVSDPVLEVAGGRGELRASVGGHASSQTDQTVWQEVPAQVVTLATLSSVDLSDPRGFTATPDYLGVTVSGVPQVTGASTSGSFPQSFVDQLDRLGAAAFWYSSGTSTDPFKVALPLTVGLGAAGGPPAGPPPTSAATTRPPSVQNSAPVRPSTSAPAPTPTTDPAASASATPTAAPQPQPVALPPLAAPTAADPVPEDAAAGALLAQPPTATRVVPVAAVTAATAAADPWPWWLGSALLLLAAASLLVPPRSARRP